MRIAAVGSAFPPHFYDQEELIAALEELWAAQHVNRDRLRRLHSNVLVGGRYLSLPLDAYSEADHVGSSQ